MVENPQIPVDPRVPIDASASELAVMARNFMLQLVLVAGAIVTMLSLPETSFLARAVKFLKSEDATPILGMASSLLGSGWLLIRARRKHRQLQTVSSLPTTPNSVAIGPARPSAAVAEAIAAATVIVEQSAPATERPNL